MAQASTEHKTVVDALNAKLAEVAGALNAKEELREARSGQSTCLGACMCQYPNHQFGACWCMHARLSFPGSQSICVIDKCRSKHRQELAALKSDLQRLQVEAKGGVRGKDMVS
jgi:hypothetical protein